MTTAEKKDQALSGFLTLILLSLLLLAMILIKIITPLPPFPQSGGNEGEELNFGIYNEGTGNVEGPGIGDATSVVAESAAIPKKEESVSEDESFKNGEAVLEEKEHHPRIKNKVTTITTYEKKTEVVKKEEDKTAQLLNAYKTTNNNSGSSGGDGNSGQAGNEGVPDGNPFTDGQGGNGNNKNGKGVGRRGGRGGSGFDLSGRKMLTPPPKVSDSKEEGIVVVNITVDAAGNVTEADPTGKGTNTSSAILKSKARQAALQAKFNAADESGVQRGSIVFKFQF